MKTDTATFPTAVAQAQEGEDAHVVTAKELKKAKKKQEKELKKAEKKVMKKEKKAAKKKEKANRKVGTMPVTFEAALKDKKTYKKLKEVYERNTSFDILGENLMKDMRKAGVILASDEPGTGEFVAPLEKKNIKQILKFLEDHNDQINNVRVDIEFDWKDDDGNEMDLVLIRAE